MPVQVKIDFGPVRAQLERLGSAVRSPLGLMAALANWLIKVSRDAFQKQQSPEGSLWAPLSLLYGERKAKLRPGKPILQYSGTLLRTLGWGYNDRGAWVESRLPYAATHQFGSDRISSSGIVRLVQVKQFTRRQKSRDVFTGGTDPLRGFKTKRRQVASGIATVGGFVRLAALIPARPYLPGIELAELEGQKISEEYLQQQIDGVQGAA